ncbi:MAG: hypothetical protein GWN67_15140 [Phycisphaerae bacterium]|nr:hypothetical protein [Phycisphaerae bacterium]NIP53441.1 hypothetical protein [Phycisphaerae bacterium]NIS52691.1 hypothetical protein [Phycisphaerae bacterium]NIU09933.1 hypothetical protein [Phycisphaerae bacterium]NIU57671.1 hypothetical protein [Phycisphaerae bacterium]
MVFAMDMKKLKQDSYRLIRRDGLSDICAGLMLAMAAVFFFNFRYAGALIVACSMQTIILPLCRKNITYPRVGYAKFPARADKKTMIFWDFAVPLIAIALIVSIGIWARWLLPVSLGLLLAGLSLAGARITGYLRDFVIVGLFITSGFAGLLFIWNGKDPALVTAYQLWILSVILVTVGLVQLICFLNKYPKPPQEIINE